MVHNEGTNTVPAPNLDACPFNVQTYASDVVSRPASFGFFVRAPHAFEDSLRLLRGSLRLGAPLVPSSAWPGHRRFLEPDIGYWFHHLLQEPEGRRFVRAIYTDYLTAAETFAPTALYALFWALAKGETDFVRQCVPLWSHEERLTGGLLRSLFAGLALFEAAFRQLAGRGVTGGTDGSAPRLDFFVADLSTGRREKETGADFGVILDVSLPDEPRLVKACRFQAKKAYSDGRATIDLDQVEALLRVQDMGYELFYHQHDATGAAPPPTAVGSSGWSQRVEQGRKEDQTGELGAVEAQVRNKGCDLAVLLTFGLSDAASSVGVAYPDAQHAAWDLFGGRQDGCPPVARALAVSLGDGPSGAEGRVVTWAIIFEGIARELQG